MGVAAVATGKGHSGSPEGLTPPAAHLKLMSQQFEMFSSGKQPASLVSCKWITDCWAPSSDPPRTPF